MANRTIALVYFSATNVTHSYAEAIQKELTERGCAVQVSNVTALESRRKVLSFADCDGVIFGFPVFSNFAPRVINEWLPTLEGRGKKCAAFFTYGGRTAAYAPFHTSLLLEKADFRLMLAAEFPGRHSFNVGGWQILPDRPNAEDFSVAREFAALAIERFSRNDAPPLTLQKPFGYPQVVAELENAPKPTKRLWINPVRVEKECSMCRICETECPAGAFDADTGLSDPATCIGCMHCVYVCPDKVVQAPDIIPEKTFLSNWHVTKEMIEAKKARIIAESWQAAY
ncbi:MAG: 4Fe-4S dicluster domain-containing protein [Syntrophobacteraceae bacterium]